MNFPVKFSVRAGETYDATITQLNAEWGSKFVDEFEQKVTKTIGLISASPTLYPLAESVWTSIDAFCIKTAPCFTGYTQVISPYCIFGITGRNR